MDKCPVCDKYERCNCLDNWPTSWWGLLLLFYTGLFILFCFAGLLVYFWQFGWLGYIADGLLLWLYYRIVLKDSPMMTR